MVVVVFRDQSIFLVRGCVCIICSDFLFLLPDNGSVGIRRVVQSTVPLPCAIYWTRPKRPRCPWERTVRWTFLKGYCLVNIQSFKSLSWQGTLQSLNNATELSFFLVFFISLFFPRWKVKYDEDVQMEGLACKHFKRLCFFCSHFPFLSFGRS
jgi:hypothetical protein